MDKRTKTTLAIIAILILAIIVVVCFYRLKKNRDNNSPGKNNSQSATDSGSQETLGTYQCLSKFNVERGSGAPEQPINLDVSQSGLQLESFKSFAGGAFSGKIKNYQPEMNKDFPGLSDELMKEKGIRTIEHLKANICLFNQDFLNPPGGAAINYYIEHYYCTNSCQWGHYKLRADLDTDGNFVGYRYDQN